MEHFQQVWHTSRERLPFRTTSPVPLFRTYPDSMDALAQHWFMVGWLADGWRWFTTVGPTLPR